MNNGWKIRIEPELKGLLTGILNFFFLCLLSIKNKRGGDVVSSCKVSGNAISSPCTSANSKKGATRQNYKKIIDSLCNYRF